jgi:hypothetical protein
MIYSTIGIMDNKWTKFATANSMPGECFVKPVDDSENSLFPDVKSPLNGIPEDMLESVEVYTKVLLVPPEFSAKKQSTSKLH